MNPKLKALATFVLALGSSSIAASAQQVHYVPSGGSIANAIAAASDGDLILLDAGGTYAGFSIDGKSLSVVAAGMGTSVAPPVAVKNLAVSQNVLLRGLMLWDDFLIPPPLQILGCSGPVWVEDCDLRGGGDLEGIAEGAFVSDSASVAFLRCTLTGAPGWYTWPFPTTGAEGLVALNSDVVVIDSVCAGGAGGSNGHVNPCIATAGGPGVFLGGGSLFASGTILHGGNGGSSPCGPPQDGPGGAGLFVNGAATIVECDFVGGAPHGPRATGPGTIEHLGRHSRSFEADALVREGQSAALELIGEPGELATVFFSRAPSLSTLAPDLGGVLLVELASSVDVVVVGPLRDDGALEASWTAPLLPPGIQGLPLYVQPIFHDAAGGSSVVGPASAMWVIERG